MENNVSRSKTRGILLLFLSLFLFIALLYLLPNLKNNPPQDTLVKLDETLVADVPVKEELPASPVIVEEPVAVAPAVVETQSQPVVIKQEDELKQVVEIVPEKQIIERKIWQSNKGRLISNKEYVYFGKYIIVKEEVSGEGSKNN